MKKEFLAALVVMTLFICGLTAYSIYSFSRLTSLQTQIEKSKKDLEELTANQEKFLDGVKADQDKIMGSMKEAQESKAGDMGKLSSQLQAIKNFLTDQFDTSPSMSLAYSYFQGADWKSQVADIISKSAMTDGSHTRVVSNGVDNTFTVPGGANVVIDGVWFSGIENYIAVNNQKNTFTVLAPGLGELPHDTLTIAGDKGKDTVFLDACLNWKEAGKDKAYMSWKGMDSVGAVKTVKISKGMNIKIQDKCDALYLRPYQLETDLAALKEDNPIMNRMMARQSRFDFMRFRHSAITSFGGTGITFSSNTDISKGMKIEFVTPGKPGDKAGLKRGDTVIKIDGVPVTDIGLEQAHGKIRGVPGTPVTLTYIPQGQSADSAKNVTLIRELMAGLVQPNVLPVLAVGGSPAVNEGPLEQTVRLLKVTQVRQGDGYIEIMGSGSARMNGNQSIISGPQAQSPAENFDVTIQESKKDQYADCAKLVGAPEASYAPVDITGIGAITWTNSVHTVKLQSIYSCQKSDIQGTDLRLRLK